MQLFQVKFKWLASIDTKIKKITLTHLVLADTCTLVEKITRQLYLSSSPGFLILEIKTSKITEVFLKQNK